MHAQYYLFFFYAIVFLCDQTLYKVFEKKVHQSLRANQCQIPPSQYSLIHSSAVPNELNRLLILPKNVVVLGGALLEEVTLARRRRASTVVLSSSCSSSSTADSSKSASMRGTRTAQGRLSVPAGRDSVPRLPTAAVLLDAVVVVVKETDLPLLTSLKFPAPPRPVLTCILGRASRGAASAGTGA